MVAIGDKALVKLFCNPVGLLPHRRFPPPLQRKDHQAKGAHVIGDLFHLVLLHQENFGDLFTWALEDAGDQRVVGVLQLLLF